MAKKYIVALNIVIALGLLFLLPKISCALSVSPVVDTPTDIIQQGYIPKNPVINSIEVNFFTGAGVSVTGTGSIGDMINIELRDEEDKPVYSIYRKIDEFGNWKVVFDQPLKKGNYYAVAFVESVSGAKSESVKSDIFKVAGPFAFIIGVFSVLLAIFTLIFILGWMLNKWAERRRQRRIIISERDVASSYNVIKKDTQRALALMADRSNMPEGKINEIYFLLKRIDENTEKMKNYIPKGINIIGEYDMIKKFNKEIKLNKKIT